MKKIIVFLSLIIISFIIVFLYLIGSKSLKIVFFNMEKSDSILITYKDKTILIDTSLDIYSNNIISYLNRRKIKTIDYLIVTHFDKDHVGGASKIIDNFDVKNIYQSNYIKTSEYYENYIKSINDKNIKPIIIEKNYSFKLDELDFTIYGIDKVYDEDPSNNSSLVTLLKYKNNSFLFTGDIEKERISDFINEDINSVDVLKMPHHGKYNKELKKLLNMVKPKYVVITNNDIEEKTKDLLNKNKIEYYLTKDNKVTVLSNGNSITIKYGD